MFRQKSKTWNGIIKRSLTTCDITAIREPNGCNPSDGKKPEVSKKQNVQSILCKIDKKKDTIWRWGGATASVVVVVVLVALVLILSNQDNLNILHTPSKSIMTMTKPLTSILLFLSNSTSDW